MTLCTVRSITFVVYIIDAVTIVTLFRGVLIVSCRMARFTACLGVCGLEFEFGFIVIKPGFIPLLCGMAAVAVSAKSSLVNIVFFVTIAALMAGFTKLFPGNMAGLAGDSPVAPVELKIGETMLKGLTIQTTDVHFSTNMVSVTTAAFGCADNCRSSVEACFFEKITIDILVTIQAQCCLLLLVKQAVAFSAATLVFCVPFDKGARHNQRLKHTCFSSSRII